MGPKNEGLSYVQLEEGVSITLRAGVESAKHLIVGPEYAKTHAGLNRLATSMQAA